MNWIKNLKKLNTNSKFQILRKEQNKVIRELVLIRQELTILTTNLRSLFFVLVNQDGDDYGKLSMKKESSPSPSYIS